MLKDVIITIIFVVLLLLSVYLYGKYVVWQYDKKKGSTINRKENK